VVDVRLNNASQLAGFAKANDLKYFLDRILGAELLTAESKTPLAVVHL
jgi:hypothetical protein